MYLQQSHPRGEARVTKRTSGLPPSVECGVCEETCLFVTKIMSLPCFHPTPLLSELALKCWKGTVFFKWYSFVIVRTGLVWKGTIYIWVFFSVLILATIQINETNCPCKLWVVTNYECNWFSICEKLLALILLMINNCKNIKNI